MSAEIINLRRVKKNLARAEAEKLAEANRVKFGRSKIEKSITATETKRITVILDGKKRED